MLAIKIRSSAGFGAVRDKNEMLDKFLVLFDMLKLNEVCGLTRYQRNWIEIPQNMENCVMV